MILIIHIFHAMFDYLPYFTECIHPLSIREANKIVFGRERTFSSLAVPPSSSSSSSTSVFSNATDEKQASNAVGST